MSFLGLNEVADWAGDLFSRATGAKQANDMAQAQFDEQMDHSIERRVKDGLRAGINPLAAIGASANVSPTIHSGGGSGVDGLSSMFNMFGKAGSALKNMFVKKAEDDVAYDKEAKSLDLESKRLENRILRNRVAESDLNLSQGSAKEIQEPTDPSRKGDNLVFKVAYDLHGRPRLVVNQDVMEMDNDNAAYRAAIASALADGMINKRTGKVSQQYAYYLDDLYNDVYGRHIDNLDELYVDPYEMATTGFEEVINKINSIRGLKK